MRAGHRELAAFLQAALATVLAVAAFAALRARGLSLDASLIGGMALAAILNIAGLAALNRDLVRLTSGGALGEH